MTAAHAQLLVYRFGPGAEFAARCGPDRRRGDARRGRRADPWLPSATLQFSAPQWLRDLGFSSWLLVGFVLVIVGLIWLLGQTSTIVMPVILATVLGAVAGPAVGWLERHRVPRIGGAILVLLGLVAIGVLDLLPRLRRHIGPVGGHLGEDRTRRWTRSRAG